MTDFKKRIELLKQKLKPEKIQEEIKEIEVQSARPEFWQDQLRATEQMKRLRFLEKELSQLNELEELLAKGETEKLTKKLEGFELKTFLSGKHDALAAILSIHAGQGGVEAMDWTEMLKRMYIKYLERKDWPYQVVDETPGEEAGVKSVTLKVDEPYAYGYLKHEGGTHRLVRQSPFNADRLRQTSFALVEVLPQIEETPEVEIKDDDLEWQFFRSSSQGGQHVQKVSTAVRVKHKPTGLVVTSQAERYQEQNRKIALGLLRAKLWAQAKEKVEKEKEKLKKGRKIAAWGTQIRSYVLHPYKMVKDLRTNWQTAEAEAVLDGELDGLIQAELKSLS